MFTMSSLFEFIFTIEKLSEKKNNGKDWLWVSALPNVYLFMKHNNSVLTDLFNFSGFSIIGKVSFYFSLFLFVLYCLKYYRAWFGTFCNVSVFYVNSCLLLLLFWFCIWANCSSNILCKQICMIQMYAVA